MHKLGNLIISGTEVYALPQSPEARPAYEQDASQSASRRESLLTVLLHTLSAGAPPLPLAQRGR